MASANLKAFIVLLSLLALVVACGGTEERKAKYRTRAQAYIEEGNFPKALVALRNVLKIDPQDAEAYYLAAQVEEKDKNWRNAFGNYQRVVELVPDHHGALVKLAKYYLEAHFGEKVLEMADRILATYPDDPQAQALRIAVLALDGKIPEATAKAKALVTRFPTEPDAAVLLAMLYTETQRLTAAESVLRRAVQAHPYDFDLLNSLGAVLIRMGDAKGAEQVFVSTVEHESTVFDHWFRLARFYDQQNAFDKTEAVLREAIRLAPESEQRRLSLADFLASRKGAKEGETALLEAAQHLPHSLKIQFALGSMYERTNQDAKARNLYESLLNRYRTKPEGFAAKVRLARIDLLTGKPDEAERQLQEVLKENPRDADALILQGQMALARKDGKEAIQAFRTILKDQPELADIQFLLGRAYLLSGEVGLAREVLERAVALDPRQYEARRILAWLDSGAGRTKEARQRLEDILKTEPGDLASLGLLLNLQVAARDWGHTKDTLSRIRNIPGANFLADVTEGHLYLARRQYDKAVGAFERALAANQDAPEPLIALVRIEVNQGRLVQAQARLKDVLSHRPNHPYAHSVLGEVLLLQGDQAGAESRFRDATRLKPDWVTPWLNWATLKLSQKKPEEAEQILRAGLGANPRAEELHMLLASTLGERGQADLAIQEYETVLRNDPRAVLAANNLAMLLAERKGDPASLERALVLSRNFEKTAPHPFFLDTLGWVYLKMGHQNDALRIIKQAASKAPDQPVLNYHLAMAYYKAGKKRDAVSNLEKALQSPTPFAEKEEAQRMLLQLRREPDGILFPR